MTISHKMQDKAMEAILDYYEKHQANYITGDFLVYKQICSDQEVKHLIDVLCSKQLITYDFEQGVRVIRLAADGKKYFEDQTSARWEYVKSKWIDFLALIVAIISLIIAIDAHIKLPPTQ